MKNHPDRLVCPSNDSNEHVEYEGRIFDGTLDTVVLSILIRWFEEVIVRTTIKIRTAARTLNNKANRTIKLDPLLLVLLPVKDC